jgi:hypothetical protein
MLTWGASDFVDPKTGAGNGKFEMSLQFPNGEYASADTDAFLASMQAFEAKIKSDALLLSKEWFGKVHKNAEVVDALYSPMLKYSKDKETGEPDLTRAPVLRVKLPMWEGVWKCEVYDEDGLKLFPSPDNTILTPVDLIQKGTQVMSLIQCGGLWFANGKFGVTWKLIQVVVQKPRASLSGHCFIKLKPGDKDKLKAAPARSADVVDDDYVMPSAEVDDSDDDDPHINVLKRPFVPEPEPAGAPLNPEPEPNPSQVAPAGAGGEEPKKKKVIKKKLVGAEA